MNTNATFSVKLDATTTDDAGQIKPDYLHLFMQIAAGLGADKADQIYVRGRKVVNNATPDVIDLNGGTLIGSDFTTFSLAKLGTLIIVNRSIVQTLKVKPAAANGLTGAGTPFEGATGNYLPPASDANLRASIFLIHCQAATVFNVAAGTDRIQVETDGGANVPYLAGFIGRSA